jgi:hypothetical protein
VIRQIFAAALATGDAEAETHAAILSTAGIVSDAPDWPEWQRSVRGRTAAESCLKVPMAWGCLVPLLEVHLRAPYTEHSRRVIAAGTQRHGRAGELAQSHATSRRRSWPTVTVVS